jgi:S1-C subfamily serine protease
MNGPFRHFAISVALALACACSAVAETSFSSVVSEVQPKLAKVYGAGGVRGLEAYQSGLLVSADGYVLTAWSYVLDSDVINVTLDDGRKFDAQLVGADPRLEIALLKIDARELPYFKLDVAVEVQPGDRVLAFSNLFGVATGNESTSVLHGVVSARTKLNARRGAFQTAYQGDVYVLDAMTNNPGAAGGVLTDRQGRLAGVLGKELRNSHTNTWLNFALPAGDLVIAVEDIKAGKTRPRSADENVKRPTDAHNLTSLGLVLVPDILAKTPPFVDRVERDSPAAKAGLKADDLILFVNGRIVSSCRTLIDELRTIDRVDELHLTVQRDSELLEISLTAP